MVPVPLWPLLFVVLQTVTLFDSKMKLSAASVIYFVNDNLLTKRAPSLIAKSPARLVGRTACCNESSVEMDKYAIWRDGMCVCVGGVSEEHVLGLPCN